ncbi:A24 family peptidase [Hansschlegelia plantiphila]|uniref:Type 4 prepilin peptidase 1 n=1 Tax=Hansschlegelia plantiphila TaxID=374655 RepID=A0A9W6MU82_9HYPH|nr:prepilin peptidase [Hansschlegelia plantiphila]GLK66613.1 type 4 prepilin peptidase 1 [Hansschlegelia plantiphila]
MLETLVVVILPALVVVAAVSDLMTMTIPNRLVLALTIAFAAAAPAAGFGVEQVFWHLAAGGLVLAIGVLLFIPGWIGGGDAKLAAALALWLGTEPLLAWFALFALFGGALTLAILYYRKAPLPLRFDRVGWMARLHDPRAGVPYGVALAAGTLLMWPDTTWFAGLV